MVEKEYSHDCATVFMTDNDHMQMLLAHRKSYSGSNWFAKKILLWIIFKKRADSLVTAKTFTSLRHNPGAQFSH